MTDLNDIDVLILGLGASGLAMARWCARHGARVRVWDSREDPPQAATLAADVPSSQRLQGALSADAMDGIGRVFKSPGLAPTDPQLAALTAEATRRGVRVEGELDLFAQALAALKAQRRYDPKVLAITGTNGKTTTTMLTGQLVERAGKRVAVAGNVGPTMLDTLAAALDAQAVADVEAAAKQAEEDAVLAEQARVQAEAEAIALADAEAQVAGESTVVDEAPNTPEDVAAGLDPSDAAAPTDDVRLAAEAAREDPTNALAAQAQEAVARVELADAEARVADETTVVDDGADLADAATDVEPADTLDDAPPAAPALPDDEDAPIVLAPPPEAAPVFSHLPEVWVLELSSFQLDGVQGFEPTAAAVLNVTQDHLDWHGDMAAYAAAKARIFGAHAVMVVNRDDAAVEAMIPPPVIVKATQRGQRAKTIHRHVVRFGLDAPRHPGDFGVDVQNGMAWLVRAEDRDPTLKLKKGEQEELHVKRLMPADALRIRGRHNAANALAALALAHAAGCGLAPLLHGLRDYRGEPHRVETIGLVGPLQTEFIDDSKGTNVGATVAALNGLGPDRAPAKLVVILGGDGKGQDFTPLADGLRRHARAAATIGRDAAALEAVLQQAGVPFQRHASLEDATRWCLDQCQNGDAVLLSPACASLDMFKDYAHRARVFADTMHALAEERGGSLE